MASNKNQQKYPYIYQQPQQQSIPKSNPMAAVIANQAMMGNNDFLWGSLAGNWLGNYLQKLLANLANGKTKPSVNEDKVEQLTRENAPGALNMDNAMKGAFGDYQPPPNYEFNNDVMGRYQTPWERAQQTPQEWINPGVYDDEEINRYLRQQGYAPFITR